MKHRFPDSVAHWMPSNKLYPNPHKGFTTFQRYQGDKLNSDWTVENGHKMEWLPDRTYIYQGDVPDYPHSTIAYFRVPWRVLEPEEGCYHLEVLDDILKTAQSRGQHVMFRFTPHSNRPGPLELPDWFCQKLNQPPRKPMDKRSPDHPLYYQRYGDLIRTVGTHIDGDPRVTAVDMALISAWGEGDQIDFVAEENWKALVDAYMLSFRNTPISAQFNHPDSVHYANRYRPIGFRADCLGNMRCHMIDHYPRFFPLMGDLWEKAPIAFEVCWVVQHWMDMGWDIDYIIEQSLKWHITSFNAKSAPIPAAWMGKAEDWIRKMGYRYALRRVDYPTEAAPGDVLHLSFWIENRGVAPIYHKYPFILRLRSEQGYFDFLTDADVTGWLPGDNLWDGTVTLPASIPTGTYFLEAGLQRDGDTVHFATDAPEQEGFIQISGPIRIE